MQIYIIFTRSTTFSKPFSRRLHAHHSPLLRSAFTKPSELHFHGLGHLKYDVERSAKNEIKSLNANEDTGWKSKKPPPVMLQAVCNAITHAV